MIQTIEQALTSSLTDCGNPLKVVLAYSGGMDSTVLLNALVQLRNTYAVEELFSIRAIHVNHQLNPLADEWESFSRNQCVTLGVDFFSTRVSIDTKGGGSLEDLARKARYAVFSSQVHKDEVILMAHHLDDQIETIFFRLMRAAGPKGLAGIPQKRPFAATSILRPFLTLPRKQLQEFAKTNQLQWIDDDSNQDVRFDRNFCRHEILPLIEKRWPQYRKNWFKSSLLCRETDDLLQDLAELDFAQVKTLDAMVLNIETLLSLSTARQKNVIRYWINFSGLELPSSNKLLKIVNEVLLAASGSQPEVILNGYEVRRFKQRLHLLKALPEIDDSVCFQWDLQQDFPLPNNGYLHSQQVVGSGLNLVPGSAVSIKYRQGGESCKLVNRPAKRLKKLLLEEQIPPWIRNRLPLLFVNGKLACIPGIGVCEGFSVGSSERGVEISWKPPSTT